MKAGKEFAICIVNQDEALLTPRKLYQVLPDASASRSDYVRIIDDEGEDYLYPKDFFVFVTLPTEAADSVLEVA
ncbi:MAG TPA: hypothetical protein VFZ49_01475 [Pyrinomonadaceae bacterium]